MVSAAFVLRRASVARRWPLALVLAVGIHLAAPATLGGLYHAFRPKGGLVGEQQTRAGLGGSGRLADIGPGLRLWEKHPIFGQGVGTEPTRGSVVATGGSTEGIIFDDQYLSSLVELGIVGLLGTVWFVWAAFTRLGRTARRTGGLAGDLVAASCIACVGFTAGMITFDAFSFVQVTLIFFVVAAVGLRARELTLADEAQLPTVPRTAAGGSPPQR